MPSEMPRRLAATANRPSRRSPRVVAQIAANSPRIPIPAGHQTCRSSNGGSATKTARSPSAMPIKPAARAPETRGKVARSGASARTLTSPPPLDRRGEASCAPATDRGRGRPRRRTARRAPGSRSVRLSARFGLKISGSRFLVDVPVSRAPNKSAAKPTPTAVFRPSRATAIPMNPMVEIWTSLTARRNCQPRMSIAPGEAGEASGDGHCEEVVARDADASIACSFGIEAHGAHLVSERRSVQDHPVRDEGADRDEETHVEPLEHRVPPEHGQMSGLDDVVRYRVRLAARPPCSGAGPRARRGTSRTSRRSS